MPIVKDSERRVVEKDGNINVKVAMKERRSWSWLALWDYGHLLKMNWISFLSVSFLTFTISCAFFGFLVVQISKVHEYDEKKMSYVDRQAYLSKFNAKLFKIPQCFPEVNNTGDAFLFVLETITTIGYGTKYPEPRCPEAVIMTMMMSFWSLMLTALFVGMFLAKFTIRTGTSRIRFSTKALVGQIDGSLYLMFRIADPMASGSDLLELKAFVCLNNPEIRDEAGERVSGDRVSIDHLGRLACSCTPHGRAISRIPLMWPMTIYHKMEEGSPLYNLNPEKLETQRFEIIVKVSGVRSESGGTIFSTTSYTNKEVSWGSCFDENYVLFRRQEGNKAEEAFNMASFGQEDIDQANSCDTPLISARAMAEPSQLRESAN